MRLKLIIAMVANEKTELVIEAARKAGATGATIITNVRGEGLIPEKTFLGLDLEAQRDTLLFIVAEPMARTILEAVAVAAKFDEEQGSGIAIQLDIEDFVGLGTQKDKIIEEIEETI